MSIYFIQAIDQLDTTAQKLLCDFPHVRIFAFYGEMGSGKTTFIKALCRSLQVTDETTSPTFAIINEYNTRNGEIVYHFDFYRIKSPRELFDVGYEEYFYSGRYCFVEWPELAEEIFPASTLQLRLSVLDDGTRMLITP